jgi:hypothetical protein
MSMRRKLASIAIAAAAVLVPAAPALAQYTGPTPPEVLPSDTQTPAPTTAVLGEKRTRGVALTGADVAGLAALGGIAVASGTVVLRVSRKRS